MTKRVLSLLSMAIVPFASACMTQPTEASSMTYDGCSRASFCTVRGTLTIELVDHVKMGRLQLGDASCVNISLSQHAIQQAERRPGRFQKLSGKVKHGQMDENMTSVTVNGRRIGLSQCGDFYVFVE